MALQKILNRQKLDEKALANRKFKRKTAAKNVAFKIARFFMIFGLCFIVLFPIIYMISTAFREQGDMMDPSVMWIPKNYTVTNLTDVIGFISYWTTLLTTLRYNILSSILQIISCALAGYGFARFKFPFSKILFSIVIFTIVIPPQLILIPQYMLLKQLSLTNTGGAFYVPAIFANGLRAGLFILLFRQNFRNLPKELEDSAYLDGAGPLRSFVQVIVPNALSIFLTVFLFGIVWYWNDTYISGTFFSNNTTMSLQIANLPRSIGTFLGSGAHARPIDFVVWLEAACLLCMAPLVIIYVFLQRYFTEGIERSGLVG